MFAVKVRAADLLAERLRAHLPPVGRICEADRTKRSASEIGLGATVVGSIGKP
jgi:hypothetical protein